MPSTFPTTISDLNSYLKVVTPYLSTNAVRLGIDPDKMSEYVSLYGDENTRDTYLWCYRKWTRKESGKTMAINLKLRNISAKLKKMLAEIFNDIPAAKWTEDDRLIFNRKKGLPYRKTHSTAPVNAELIPDIEARRFGNIYVSVGSGSTSAKDRITQGADAVEIAYVVVESPYRQNTENDFRVKKHCEGPEDDTRRFLSFRPRFSFQVDSNLAGYFMYIWLRWTNSRHPSRAGVWSTRNIVHII